MFVVYVIALVATAVELLISISAMFSRWGSFVTTFFAAVRRLSVHSHGQDANCQS